MSKESTPQTFPSLDETKLSSILQSLDPSILQQVQSDILSINSMYRSDLTNQLQSLLDTQHKIHSRYNKLQTLMRKRVVENAEMLNHQLNKKLDKLKLQHDEVDHFRSNDGMCEVQGLVGDVMGKCMGIVDTLKEWDTGDDDNGNLDGVDWERFPLLKRVLGVPDDDCGSFEEISHEGFKTADEPEEEITNTDSAEALGCSPQEVPNLLSVRDRDQDAVEEEHQNDSDNNTDDDFGDSPHEPGDQISISPAKHTGTPRQASVQLTSHLLRHLSPSPSRPASASTTTTKSDPLESIERSISKYKSRQLSQPSTLTAPLAITIPSVSLSTTIMNAESTVATSSTSNTEDGMKQMSSAISQMKKFI